jgi:hypothetical protein
MQPPVYAPHMPTYRELGFLDRRRFDRRTGEFIADPLRERLPIYVKSFLMGAAATVAVALVVFWLSSARIEHAVGYSFILVGTLLLLVGGARGGGYSNLSIGAVEALIGGRNRSQDDLETDEDLRRGKVMERRDPMERLRKGLRPPPNPVAFWLAIAGLLYLAIGAAIIL